MALLLAACFSKSRLFCYSPCSSTQVKLWNYPSCSQELIVPELLVEPSSFLPRGFYPVSTHWNPSFDFLWIPLYSTILPSKYWNCVLFILQIVNLFSFFNLPSTSLSQQFYPASLRKLLPPLYSSICWNSHTVLFDSLYQQQFYPAVCWNCLFFHFSLFLPSFVFPSSPFSSLSSFLSFLETA